MPSHSTDYTEQERQQNDHSAKGNNTVGAWNKITVNQWNKEADLTHTKFRQLKNLLTLTIRLKDKVYVTIIPCLPSYEIEHKIHVKDFEVHIADIELKYWNFHANESFPSMKSWHTIPDEILNLGLQIKKELIKWMAGERDTFLDPEEFENYKDENRKLDNDLPTDVDIPDCASEALKISQERKLDDECDKEICLYCFYWANLPHRTLDIFMNVSDCLIGNCRKNYKDSCGRFKVKEKEVEE